MAFKPGDEGLPGARRAFCPRSGGISKHVRFGRRSMPGMLLSRYPGTLVRGESFAVFIIYIGWVAMAPYRLIYLSGIGGLIATYLLYIGLRLLLKRIRRKNTNNDMLVDLDYSDPIVMWTSKRGGS